MRFQAIFEGNEYYGTPSEARSQAMAEDVGRFLRPGYEVAFREDELAPGLVRPVITLDYDLQPPVHVDAHTLLVYRVSDAMDAAGLYAVRAWIKAVMDPVASTLIGAATLGATGAMVGGSAGSAGTEAAPSWVGGLLGALFGGLLGAAISKNGIIHLGATRVDGEWRFWQPSEQGARWVIPVPSTTGSPR